jgi:hypothetical protein
MVSCGSTICLDLGSTGRISDILPASTAKGLQRYRSGQVTVGFWTSSGTKLDG